VRCNVLRRVATCVPGGLPTFLRLNGRTVAIGKELSSTGPGPMGATTAGLPPMKTIVSALTGLLLLAVAPVFGQTADASRQEAVRERSADVMPFDMNATTHIFTKTPEGGVQRVVVKTPPGHKADCADSPPSEGHRRQVRARRLRCTDGRSWCGDAGACHPQGGRPRTTACALSRSSVRS
jgi:hypothetical protein